MNKPMYVGSEWDLTLIDKMWTTIDKMATETFGLDYYEPQIEIISSEQMLDCYSSVAMPHMYPHWSFGKTFLQNERQYKKGMQGLAYEVVINTNPCLTYLMENNTATLQCLVLCHAACVDGDTEVLTDKGWIKISNYTGQKIAQYKEDGTIDFKLPKRFIETYSDKFYEIKARGVSQRLTPDHTVVYKINDQIRKSTAEEFVNQHESKTRGHNGKFITHFKYSGKGLNLTDTEIRLAVAIKADGSFQNKINSGHFNCVEHNRVRFHLKKDRKLIRLRNILNTLGIEYNVQDTYEGRKKIAFNIPIDKYTKTFDTEWYSATKEQLEIIGEEVLYWDGDQKNSFSTTIKSCADYVQYVWASTGHGTSIREYQAEGKKLCYQVYRGEYSERSISRSRGGVPNEIKELPGGNAYCFTTDTGMWVARRDNCIFVTGNCGHSSFFKTNYLFKNWTDADSILDYLKYAKNYIKKCEEKYGENRVEKLLDACHSLQSHGIDKYKKPSPLKGELAYQREKKWEQYFESTFNDLWRTIPKKPEEHISPFAQDAMEPEENLLYFIEKNSPILETWEREVVRIVRKIAQYFYPQRQTQLMNEGFASFTHHMLMTELHEQGYITEGAYLEFLVSHSGVIAQRDWDSKYYSGINVYALGFAMFTDIKRMCQNPDDEDRQWVPSVCDTPWLQTIKDIVANYRDESFILQFLSPKVARQFKLFSMHIDENVPYLTVNGTHDDESFKQIRQALAEQYDLSRSVPQIDIVHVDWKTDRWLYLEHTTKNNQRLSYNDMKKTCYYINKLWGFPIKMDYKDLDGNDINEI